MHNLGKFKHLLQNLNDMHALCLQLIMMFIFVDILSCKAYYCEEKAITVMQGSDLI
jgi:hypothetical protein